MIIFKPLSKQLCTTNSRKVILSYEDMIGVNFFYVEQHNLVTLPNF